MAVRFADLGDWGDADLRAEYDPAVPEIRINLRVAEALPADDLGKFVALAVGHELYHHRERIGEIAVAADRRSARTARRCIRARAVRSVRRERARRGNRRRTELDVAAIGDETGRVSGVVAPVPPTRSAQGSESTRLREALRGALDAACRAAALPQSARFDAIVAGISGYDGHVYGRAPELPSDRVVLLHDTPIAHAGALGGRAGVIAIAGTGSVVYGRDDRGWSCTLGGWGYVFGDEGSAFGIARDSLAMLMRAQDERDASLEEASRAACAYFGADSLRRARSRFL